LANLLLNFLQLCEVSRPSTSIRIFQFPSPQIPRSDKLSRVSRNLRTGRAEISYRRTYRSLHKISERQNLLSIMNRLTILHAIDGSIDFKIVSEERQVTANVIKTEINVKLSGFSIARARAPLCACKAAWINYSAIILAVTLRLSISRTKLLLNLHTRARVIRNTKKSESRPGIAGHANFRRRFPLSRPAIIFPWPTAPRARSSTLIYVSHGPLQRP